jgi:uncharacterized protein (TIGR02246 family)
VGLLLFSPECLVTDFVESMMMMKPLLLLAVSLVATVAGAQTGNDETAIRKIVEEEALAWTRGDATAYSRHFAANGTFTNILGEFLTGHDVFLKRHEFLFQGPYRGTTLHHDIVSLQFLRPDVALVEVLTSVAGFQKLAPALATDAKGRLRTRLLQVLVKDKGEWKIVTYHNVDVKAQTPVPEPD